jgi:hypothetical protein
MPETDAPDGQDTTPTDAAFVESCAARRLAGMSRVDASLCRRYRGLSPRGRMIATRAVLYTGVWLAGNGAFGPVAGHRNMGAAPLVGWPITVGPGTIGGTIPLPYR